MQPNGHIVDFHHSFKRTNCTNEQFHFISMAKNDNVISLSTTVIFQLPIKYRTVVNANIYY